jgi:DNA-binding NarL/FixJ family response regulator
MAIFRLIGGDMLSATRARHFIVGVLSLTNGLGPLFGGKSALERAAEVQARVTQSLAWSRGDLKAARRTGQQARILFERAGNFRRAAIAANDLGWVHGCAGDLASQERIGREVIAWSQKTGDGQTEAHGLTTLAFAALLRADFCESRQAANLAIDLAERDGTATHQAAAASLLAAWQALAGHPKEAQEILVTLPTNPRHVSAGIRTMVDWMVGNFGAILERRTKDTSRPTCMDPRRDWSLAFVAMAAVELGQLDEARALNAHLELRYGNGGFVLLSALASWAVAILAWREGDLAKAESKLSAACEGFHRMRGDAMAAFALFDRAELAAERRDADHAAAAATELAAIAARADLEPYSALACAARAWSLLRSDDRTAALDLARCAASGLFAADYRPRLARTQYLMGRLLDPIDRNQAIENLDDAISFHSRSGAVWRNDNALNMLRRLGHAGRRAVAATAGAKSLTRREREVLRLAANGQAIREIARRLFITERTVETHLANSYAKLGMRSKRDLIRAADELGV